MRAAGAGLVVAAGDGGDKGRYEESEALDADDELSVVVVVVVVRVVMMLPREPPMAAGGKANVLSNWPAFELLLPVMSVEGAGVGGKLGRGMMGR